MANACGMRACGMLGAAHLQHSDTRNSITATSVAPFTVPSKAPTVLQPIGRSRCQYSSMTIVSWRDLIGNAFRDAKFYVPASTREIGHAERELGVEFPG